MASVYPLTYSPELSIDVIRLILQHSEISDWKSHKAVNKAWRIAARGIFRYKIVLNLARSRRNAYDSMLEKIWFILTNGVMGKYQCCPGHLCGRCHKPMLNPQCRAYASYYVKWWEAHWYFMRYAEARFWNRNINYRSYHLDCMVLSLYCETCMKQNNWENLFEKYNIVLPIASAL